MPKGLGGWVAVACLCWGFLGVWELLQVGGCCTRLGLCVAVLAWKHRVLGYSEPRPHIISPSQLYQLLGNHMECSKLGGVWNGCPSAPCHWCCCWGF